MASEWARLKIGDIAERLTSGGTPSTKKEEYYGGEIPWLRTQEVNFNRIYDTELKITREGLNNSSAKIIPADSVIIAMYGATAGKSSINKIPLTTNQACCNIIIDKAAANYEFVYYSLLLNYERLASLSNGAAQQNLSVGSIREFEIPLPPLPIQRQIASILSAFDDKIELNRQMNRTLEQMARALFKSWFVDFDPVRAKMRGEQPEGMDEATAALFPSELVEVDGREVPKGWEWGSFGDVAIVNNAVLKKSDELSEIHYIEISAASRGEISEIAIYKRGEEPSRAKRKLSHGDVVLLTVRPDRESYFFVLNPNKALIASTGFAVFTAQKSEHWPLIFSGLTQKSVFKILGQLADGGAYPAVNPDVIAKLPLAIPATKEVFDKFSSFSSSLLEKSDSLRQESARLA